VNLTIKDVARALGGEVTGRASALVPGPGHGRNDRSLSIKVDPHAPDGFVAHSFAGDDWRECRDHIANKLGIERRRTSTELYLSQPSRVLDESAAEKQKPLRVRHLWTCGFSIEGSPAETYLREARAYQTAIPETLAYLPPGAYPHPAMMAAFGFADEIEPGLLSIRENEVCGLHLTFLEPDGGGKADIEPAKIMLGSSSGWPIIIAPPNDLLGLTVTEGIEDALSVHQATGLGAWAAGSAGRMPHLATVVPDHIEAVTIYAHRDEAGQRGAYGLADAQLLRGIQVFLEGFK
jgi:hypothetical protein